jgi:hypothetical protein
VHPYSGCKLMLEESMPQLFTYDQLREALQLKDEDLDWLLATRQIPTLIIRNERRFDAADVVRMITTYKSVQNKGVTHSDQRHVD